MGDSWSQRMQHRAMARVVRAWQRQGCRVERSAHCPGLLLLHPQPGIVLRCGVRVAQVHTRNHRTNGHVYQYPHLLWNLHVHGRRTEVDVWALVTDGDALRPLVIPAHEVRGKTASLLAHVKPTKRRSLLYLWQDQWELALRVVLVHRWHSDRIRAARNVKQRIAA